MLVGNNCPLNKVPQIEKNKQAKKQIRLNIFLKVHLHY